jgi:uracil-DNA glycosylase
MQNWTELLAQQKAAEHFKQALAFAESQRQLGKQVYPAKQQVFEAFNLTPFEQLKVVILGQDPYHGPGQAHGLCFSVLPGINPPPSLKNIYKALELDLAIKPVNHGYLASWATQGVFLLNTVLTVNQGEANSHKGQGWEVFTDAVIKLISEHKQHVVFLLWGKPAIAKQRLIDAQKHTILTSVHPSPLSAYRGFFEARHFSKTNEALIAHQQRPIDWQLPEQTG